MQNSEQVFDVVCKVSGISKAKMLSRSRRWPVVEARMLFVLFESRAGLDDGKISLLLGRNRTTVLKARHTAEDYIGISKAFAEKYDKMKRLYAAS